MKATSRIACAMGALLLLTGCGKSEADHITDVLHQCAKISYQASAYQTPGSQADFIARSFQGIDTSRCPQDFRMAFQAHAFAWQQAVPHIASNTFGTAVLEGVAAGLTENAGYIGQAEQQAGYAGQLINQSYFHVTQVAAKYGAKIPRSVVGG